MKEIGGYIELDNYHLPMMHAGAVALNCGRNCLAYVCKSRNIKKIKLPLFICSSIPGVCEREGIEASYYHIGRDFRPANDIFLDQDEWLYLVNYYGQLDNRVISSYVRRYSRVIVDQANAYFQEPLEGVDTLYTCRKWFGVADGAFLYTNKELTDFIPEDESFNRMEFLLGRYERPAFEFYTGYCSNNEFFKKQPIKRMSKLTNNLLHGINYDMVKRRRKENFEYLQNHLGEFNQLKLRNADFMYPFMTENGDVLRKKMLEKKIYIPLLWPNVFDVSSEDSIEYRMAKDILPLPIDQRYGTDDMDYIIQELLKVLT